MMSLEEFITAEDDDNEAAFFVVSIGQVGPQIPQFSEPVVNSISFPTAVALQCVVPSRKGRHVSCNFPSIWKGKLHSVPFCVVQDLSEI